MRRPAAHQCFVASPPRIDDDDVRGPRCDFPDRVAPLRRGFRDSAENCSILSNHRKRARRRTIDRPCSDASVSASSPDAD